MVERGYEGYVVKDRAGLDGGARGGGVQQS
jgi:hypothetical protein